MSLETVKRIASRLLDCGETRVRVTDAKLALEALTADDVRGLIKEGVVYKLPVTGVGRGKARASAARRRRVGGTRGPGSIRGTPNALFADKKRWMKRVRALRRALRGLKPSLEKGAYSRLHLIVKGGGVRDKKQLREIAKNYASKRGSQKK